MLEWSSEKPTVAGMYFHKYEDDQYPRARYYTLEDFDFFHRDGNLWCLIPPEMLPKMPEPPMPRCPCGAEFDEVGISSSGGHCAWCRDEDCGWFAHGITKEEAKANWCRRAKGGEA